MCSSWQGCFCLHVFLILTYQSTFLLARLAYVTPDSQLCGFWAGTYIRLRRGTHHVFNQGAGAGYRVEEAEVRQHHVNQIIADACTFCA